MLKLVRVSTIVALLLLSLAPAQALAGDTSAEGDEIDEIAAASREAGVLVVASAHSFPAAVRAARRYSKATGTPYETQGMVFDRKRGLIWPDDSEDEAWAGSYYARRDDLCGPQRCVTVERSGGYEGFRSGLYIVVAGIVDRTPEAEDRLRAARVAARSAYIKRTTIYYGCMH